MEQIIYIMLSLWNLFLISSGVYFITQEDCSIWILLLVLLLWADPMAQVKRYKKIQSKYSNSNETDCGMQGN